MDSCHDTETISCEVVSGTYKIPIAMKNEIRDYRYGDGVELGSLADIRYVRYGIG